MVDGISVIMPTYNQAAFIRRAIFSLLQQTYLHWELVIVNDGSVDDTDRFVSSFLEDKRIIYLKNDKNEGLGYSLNKGIEKATYNYIAYLPSDDYYFRDHLDVLREEFDKNEDIVLVYSGVRYDAKDSLFNVSDTESLGIKKEFSMQLVQAAHRKTLDRWLERKEWITNDLFAMFWHKLADKGLFSMTQKITCYWTNHPYQRHRLIAEKYGGGLNKYRGYYHVQDPIKLRVSKYKFINEDSLYSSYREKISVCEQSLKILIVGELSYNPERIYALEQAGHKLYGLWLPEPQYSFSTVGHLPFGHVEDLNISRWKDEVERIKPDVIYAMLNSGAVSFAYNILREFRQIPFVWHFKEGPFICLREGTWNELMYLYTFSTGKIYLNELTQSWYNQFIIDKDGLSMVLDGDLPKADYFKNNFSKKLSEDDNAIHILVAGRMIGIEDEGLALLADNNIHVHSYTENYYESRFSAEQKWMRIAPNHFHVHAHVSADNWTKEFSKYDIGCLHCFNSYNNNDILKVGWDDLNIPARISTYAAAGLPVMMKNNSNALVAIQDCVNKLDIGVLFDNYEELVTKLKDAETLSRLRVNMLRHRMEFSFDYHVPQLIEFFRKVIAYKKNQ